MYAPAPSTAAPTAQRARSGSTRWAMDWRARYTRRLWLTDLATIVVAVFGAEFIWFGGADSTVAAPTSLLPLDISYAVVSLLLSIAWMTGLTVTGSRDARNIGTGPEEYKLVLGASLRVFGLFAIIGFILQMDFSRGYLIIALPLGLVLLVAERWMWRQWLARRRSRTGGFSARVVVLGDLASATALTAQLHRRTDVGYRVVAACLSDVDDELYLPSTTIPVGGGADDLIETMIATQADTVIIAGGHNLTPEQIRTISWSLEPNRQHLVMAPSLVDVAGPRIHTRPVAGLPLIHVETPRLDGGKYFTKRLFDIVASAFLIIITSPVLLISAIAVKLSSAGPIIFSHTRVGINGERFTMLKFRSMVPEADAQLHALLAEQGRGDTPLFKLMDDPRITPVGAVLRRTSLDELPQLFNVLFGHMSLVGPRPQVEREVALYDTAASRRLTVKPGITGLWQVSGRSNLSWEDAIRLDLYYVENWSIAGDLSILWKTVRAVVASDGAR